jgi:hypothetical protein
MKKSVMLFVLVVTLFGLSSVSAAQCALDAELINQDPYPALPGEYVDVVFQLSGLDNPECGKVSFELSEEFPFSLDPGISSRVSVDAGIYARRFQSFLIIPYEVRVDAEALDGDNPIEVVYNYGDGGVNTALRDTFYINVEDVRVDFEVSVSDFEPSTNIITFEILNVGEHDIEALTIDVPKQENINVKGSSRNIVGSLDANEDTTFRFEATPSDGDIRLDITYTDSINVRRTVSKIVPFDSSYFMNRKADEVQATSPWFYVTLVLVVIWIIIWIRKRIKKKRLKESERRKR